MKKFALIFIILGFGFQSSVKLSGFNGYEFGISKQKATGIIKSRNLLPSYPDENTIACIHDLTTESIKYTGMILSFHNDKLYSIALTFEYLTYNSLRNKLSEKYGYKYSIDKITDTYTTLTWNFEDDKTIVISMDFENKTGMLQYTDANILAN